jgi:hypothetical protein
VVQIEEESKATTLSINESAAGLVDLHRQQLSPIIQRDSKRSALLYDMDGMNMIWLISYIKLLQGLLHLHGHLPPIIHRDLKTSAILVDQGWHCKVSDREGFPAYDLSCTPDNSRWLAPEVRPVALPARHATAFNGMSAMCRHVQTYRHVCGAYRYLNKRGGDLYNGLNCHMARKATRRRRGSARRRVEEKKDKNMKMIIVNKSTGRHVQEYDADLMDQGHTDPRPAMKWNQSATECHLCSFTCSQLLRLVRLESVLSIVDSTCLHACFNVRRQIGFTCQWIMLPGVLQNAHGLSIY